MNWITVYHSKRGNVIVDYLSNSDILSDFYYSRNSEWEKTSEGNTSAVYKKDNWKGYYDTVWDEIKISVLSESEDYKSLYSTIEATKLSAMSDAEASAFIAQHLKSLAPYVGVGGAIAYQLLDHLLGQKSKEFKDWLQQQKRLDEYKQIDIPRYMW